MRVALLLLLVQLIQWFQLPFATVHWEGVIEASFNGHSVIAMVGGGFIVYTAVKEVWHMLAGDLGSHKAQVTPKSARAAILAMVLMNAVFSFDSVLTAIALTDNMSVMVVSILLSGVIMLLLANSVAAFLKKNRAYEVLGLFILLLVFGLLDHHKLLLHTLWPPLNPVLAMSALRNSVVPRVSRGGRRSPMTPVPLPSGRRLNAGCSISFRPTAPAGRRSSCRDR